MTTFKNNLSSTVKNSENNRRAFLKKGFVAGALASVAGISLITGCKNETDKGVSPAEDLMREHGVLNRIMLIYDSCKVHLFKGEQFSLDTLNNSAQIIRSFIEDYHEKLEEDFLFPRFEKANQLTELVQVLRIQHQAGRKLTAQIIQYANMKTVYTPDDSQVMINLLTSFNAMYRPHEAREDTVLFPALRKIISKNEYFSLGEDFEDKEHKLFGKEGFETIVEKVTEIEKQLGVFDLSNFTPVHE
jgi:hemerythrin-like domain-containing protein